MLTTTLKICRTAFEGDQTIPIRQRAILLALLRNGQQPKPEAATEPSLPKVFSRQKTADVLGGKSLRYVDRLAKEGLLKRITVPGRKRGIGFSADSVEALITGTPPEPTPTP